MAEPAPDAYVSAFFVYAANAADTFIESAC
jgi:hypothetical protein